MSDSLVTNGTILTQDADREVIEDGAVAVVDDEIHAVGPAREVTRAFDADRVIDADGGAVIPGLINAHTHVSDILLRGSFAEDRTLHDWLYNVKRPASYAMEPDEHAVAARLYCLEAIQSGVTTFVENDTEIVWDTTDTTEAKLAAYAEMGIRNVYGAGFADSGPDDEFRSILEQYQARDPAVDHPPMDAFIVETDDALDAIEGLHDEYHGTADGKQSIWIAPIVLPTTTTRGFQAAQRFAERRDVMSTIHVSEAVLDEETRAISSIEYLRNIGVLGEHALLGHCVQLDERDVRILADTETSVAHNYMANMRLASGYAPIVQMLENDVTVGLGTDNVNLNDTINPLADVRAAAAGHKGYHRDAGVIDAQKALDMVTIDGARAINRADDLGSIEAGKQADLAIVDLDRPHLTPSPDTVFSLVYGVHGPEIETVLCGGDVVMEDREVTTMDRDLDAFLTEASTTATDVLERCGIA